MQNMTISEPGEEIVMAQTPGPEIEPKPRDPNGNRPPLGEIATEGEKADFWWLEIFGVLGSALSIVGLSACFGGITTSQNHVGHIHILEDPIHSLEYRPVFLSTPSLLYSVLSPDFVLSLPLLWEWHS